MTAPTANIGRLFAALQFAAYKHRAQRRKNRDASPYINHPIDVAALLAQHGVTDPATLEAAVLHDTIEDTDATAAEIDRLFGSDVAGLVREMSDDKRLPKADRKRLQIEHAPLASRRAKLIKLADKTCNIRDITSSPPADWSLQRCVEYFDWSDRVIAGCRGSDAALEAAYDEAVATGRRVLASDGAFELPT